MNLAGGRNNPLTEVTIPITAPPNGLLFSWRVALYRSQFQYSTHCAHTRPEDWQDHWLQAFYALHGLEKAQREVHLVALMRDTNWRFEACVQKDAEYQRAKMSTFKPLGCCCGFHALMSTALMALYQNERRNRAVDTLIRSVVSRSARKQGGLGVWRV